MNYVFTDFEAKMLNILAIASGNLSTKPPIESEYWETIQELKESARQEVIDAIRVNCASIPEEYMVYILEHVQRLTSFNGGQDDMVAAI